MEGTNVDTSGRRAASVALAVTAVATAIVARAQPDTHSALPLLGHVASPTCDGEVRSDLGVSYSAQRGDYVVDSVVVTLGNERCDATSLQVTLLGAGGEEIARMTQAVVGDATTIDFERGQTVLVQDVAAMGVVLYSAE